MNNIQFSYVKPQYEKNSLRINKAIRKVFKSSQFIEGNPVRQLEKSLADYAGRKYTITCGSGTDGIYLTLRALGIGAGDKVAVPSYTFFATGEAVSLVGATPVFIDVDSSYNISVSHLERALLNDTSIKALIAVDLFGRPANYRKLYPLCNKYKVHLIEDGAQSFGGGLDGRKCLSFGIASVTSFFPNKPLGCYGDGGAVFTNNQDLAKKINSLKSHGRGSFKYEHIDIGINSRLDSLQAGILMEKLQLFPKELNMRLLIANRYNHSLSKKYLLPIMPSGYKSSYSNYTIQCSSIGHRNKVVELFKRNNIPYAIYYPIPLHKQPAFTNLNLPDYKLPMSEYLSKVSISIPCHSYLSYNSQSKIISLLNSI